MGISRKLKKALRFGALGGGLTAKKAQDETDKKARGVADRAGAVTAAASAASAAQSAEQQAVAAAETEYRGRLRQPGGLASTILNLGGAAGDPDRPEASGLLGIPTQKPLSSGIDPLADPATADPATALAGRRRKSRVL